MLFRQNFEILCRLHLSQVPFSAARRALQTEEKIGRLEEQLYFIKQCKKHGIFPKTIRNIRFPNFMFHPSLLHFKETIQQMITGKLIRHLHREKAISVQSREYHKSMVFNSATREESQEIFTAMKATYQNGKRIHGSILRRRFEKLIGLNENTSDNRNSNVSGDIGTYHPGIRTKRTPTDQDILVTDLSNSLNNSEVALLSKGPKFSLAPPTNDRTIEEFNVNFSRLAFQMRWQDALKDKVSDEVLLPKYPWHTTLKMPCHNPELEQRLNRAYHKIRVVLENSKGKPRYSNLTTTERQTLRNLQNRNLVFLPCDKGSEFCTIEKDKYTEAGFLHLADASTYKKVNHISPNTIEKRINGTWKFIAKKNSVPAYITKSYVSNNITLPHFYHLIKTHKQANQLKIRPIVSSCNGPTRKIAWLLNKLLTPLLSTVPANLRNSIELIHTIENSFDPDFPYPCSFDVISMYPSIPIEDAIFQVQNKLRQQNIHSIGGIPRSDVCNLLHVVLSNTYFTFEKRIFQQIKGLPMGSPLSGLMAIIFMDNIERQALQQVPSIPFFKRYVDDCFMLTQNEQTAREFHAILNSQNENVKFEIELPSNDNCLSLLDFTISTNNSRPSFEFYKKSARKNTFVHFRSNIANGTKMAIIRNERNRITERCTNPNSKNEHLQNFDNILRLNGYPESFIHRSKQGTTKTSRNINTNNDKCYLKMPFISEKVNFKIKRILKAEKLSIGLAQKSTTTLRSVLRSRHNTDNNCRMSACPIRNNKICFQTNVVYQVTCSKCQNFYIGSTIRPLHVRIKEHVTRDSSSIFKHLTKCDTKEITTTILARERDNANIRLMEAQLINKYAPRINTKEEQEQYRQFLFL